MFDFLQGYDLLGAFWVTVQLTVYSAVGSLVWGTLLAAMRVSPVPLMRGFGSVYVNVVRNIPLTVIIVFTSLGLFQTLGVDMGADRFTTINFRLAVLGLTAYTSAFVCEALRSGINTVPRGQGEAARSLGMTFSQTLGTVVLPQAFRTVIPPIGSTLIALAKNSAIAGAFSVTELLGTYKTLSELGYNIVWTFVWIAVGYLIITLGISALFNVLEKRWGVAR